MDPNDEVKDQANLISVNVSDDCYNHNGNYYFYGVIIHICNCCLNSDIFLLNVKVNELIKKHTFHYTNLAMGVIAIHDFDHFIN